MTHGHTPRVVVGVDGSTASVRALRWAFGYAEATAAVVEAVHVWQRPGLYGAAAVQAEADVARVAEQSLATALERAAPSGPRVRVQRRVACGSPATVLLERAKDADLLVVGSHGYSGFVAAMLGSVSVHCVQHATCPVVVVRGLT